MASAAPLGGLLPDDGDGRLGAPVAPESSRLQDSLDEGGVWREGIPVLLLDGVTLREARLADAPSLFQHLSNDQVSRFMSKPPTSAQGFERFIVWAQEERRAGRCFCYGIVPAGQDGAVGLIQVRQLEPGFGAAEWGFALGPQFWGSGLFYRCAEALVDFVFRSIGAYRLEARASTFNGRGNGVLRKLGARLEGVLRQSLVGAPAAMDQYLWSLLATDWLSARPASTFATRSPEVRSPEACELPPQPRPSGAPAWTQAIPVLESPRCTLRDLKPGDAQELHRQLATDEVEQFLPPAPDTVQGFARFIDWAHTQREAGKYVCLAMVPPGGRDAVGLFQIRRLDPTFKTAEWGFVLGRDYWGTGMFLAGACLALDFTFDVVGVLRLEARAPTGNVRGNGALRKLGAVEEGRLRQSFLLGGVYHDDVLWALLAEDWHRLRDRIRPR
jgi:RimJ/RimL family protein N-acetyltransferase